MRVTVYIVELADFIKKQRWEYVGQIAEIQIWQHMCMLWVLYQLPISEL